MDPLTEARVAQIRAAADEATCSGARYYVSAEGDDRNDGLTPARAWRTPARVGAAELNPGDGVFFRRGDLFRGQVITRPGVLYAAYGTGEKPRIYGWEEDLCRPGQWIRVSGNIWKYAALLPDSGTLVFDGGAFHSRKLIPSWRDGRFVLRDHPELPFVMEAQMTRDLDLFCDVRDRFTEPGAFPVPHVTPESRGTLYLRCDRGDPAQVFSSIELLPKRNTFVIRDNADVRIDNLCLRYCGAHAVGAGGFVRGLRVTNCEIGWVGGTVQTYNGSDPNNPNDYYGAATRYGNGVEIYGGCDGYTVENCLFYEIYDAAVTHQYIADGKTDVIMRRIRYRNNVMLRCVYSIEYFLSNAGQSDSRMEDVLICGNRMCDCGAGWGRQRPNPETPTHIQGWDHDNPARNVVIRENYIDTSTQGLLHLNCKDEASRPSLEGNVYRQTPGGVLGQIGARDGGGTVRYPFDSSAARVLGAVFGDPRPTVEYGD